MRPDLAELEPVLRRERPCAVRRNTRSLLPYSGCQRYSTTTKPNRYAESRLILGPGEHSVLGCVTNVSENLQSCTEDGRRPPGAGFQESASNHPELLRSKGVVVNVRGKGVRRGRQVSVEKMSESEPSDDASSRIQGTAKTGAAQ